MSKLYETDYFAWTKSTVAALRDGRVRDVDLAEVAEEIEDLGKSERRVVPTELAVPQLGGVDLKANQDPS